MFVGISTSDTPCGGDVASRNACRRSTSIVVQSSTRLVNFENVRQTSEPYASWNEPISSSVVGCWPAMQTTELPASPAPQRPVTAFVSPQPAVTLQTPGVAV